jgi:hypothetical protein
MKDLKMNNKDVYFPHNYRARFNRKIMRLKSELGAEGYGIYFMLLEILRSETNLSFPLEDIWIIEEDEDVPKEKILNVIMNYDLFEVNDNGCFYCPRLTSNVNDMLKESKKSKEYDKLRSESRKIAYRQKKIAEMIKLSLKGSS